jgi:hypothetical protein
VGVVVVVVFSFVRFHLQWSLHGKDDDSIKIIIIIL